MASTYTTGFSIEKIGSGEQAGTWGTTSNHNWDIVDRLASYKAVALSDASTATLTVREASPGSGTENLQNGMYRAIKFTGSLSQDCTVTIAPNTAPAWFIIENAAGDDVILSQGSGANVTVQNGKNVIVYCDGAGSGAAVVDALADLQIGTLECTGAAAIDGALTQAGASQFNSTITVGVDDTGYDVKLFGATSGAYMLWDESADDLKLVGAAGLTVAGDIDVDGTTNLDAVDVDGAVNFAADVTFADGADIITASAGTSNFRAGVNAGNSIASGGNYNVCVGDEAGTALTTGTDNVLIGYGAGDGFDAEDYNVGIGTNALGGASYAAAANTAVGYQTGLAITSGTANVAVGAYCLDANTSASGNTAVGYGALSSTQTGAQTTAVGYLALNQALEDNNTAVGYGAMQGCTAGENNVAVGHAALDATLIADFNVAVGVNALSTATEGHTNTAVGYSAGRDINTGTLNTAVGGWAGVQMTTCTSNVLVGNNAGYALTSGSSNVAVGHNALYTAVTSGNQIAIGYGALQVANNTSNSNVAIGHTTGDAITDAIGNVLCGYAAGSAINTGGYNVMIGYNAGMGSNAITTGVSNIFIGNGSAPEAVGDNYEMVIAAGVNNVGKGGSTGYITAAGGAMYNGQNSTVWVVDSDRRIKKDIVPNTKGLAAIIQIEPKNFYYKSTEELQEELPGAEDKFPLNELKTSAIAQELEPIFPEAILRRGEHDIMSVDTDPIFWSMINAIKELSAEIDELKKWKEEHTGG